MITRIPCTRRSLNLLLALALVAVSCFTAPMPARVQASAPEDALVATAWFTLYTHLIQTTEGFTPPVAARAIGYAGVTLYEAVVPGLPDYQSLVGQLNALATLPQPVADQTYHWPAVANSALATITRALFRNATAENKAAIATLESQLAYKYQQQVDAATLARSVHYGRALAAAIHLWAMTDGGHEGQLHNFPTDYQLREEPGAWLPTPPAFQTACSPLGGTIGPLSFSRSKRALPNHRCPTPKR
ncbi:MAG: hypothetical protein R3E79_01905 [Caldilineaceae bacterium]